MPSKGGESKEIRLRLQTLNMDQCLLASDT